MSSCACCFAFAGAIRDSLPRLNHKHEYDGMNELELAQIFAAALKALPQRTESIPWTGLPSSSPLEETWTPRNMCASGRSRTALGGAPAGEPQGIPLVAGPSPAKAFRWFSRSSGSLMLRKRGDELVACLGREAMASHEALKVLTATRKICCARAANSLSTPSCGLAGADN